MEVLRCSGCTAERQARWDRAASSSPDGCRWSRHPALASTPPPWPCTPEICGKWGCVSTFPAYHGGEIRAWGDKPGWNLDGKVFPAPRCPCSGPQACLISSSPLAAPRSALSCPSDAGTVVLWSPSEAGRGGSRTQKRKLVEPRFGERLEIEMRFAGV